MVTVAKSSLYPAKNKIRGSEISELFCHHPVGGDVDALRFGGGNHVEQQSLYLTFVSASHVFLHGGGAVRVELVHHLQIVFH